MLKREVMTLIMICGMHCLGITQTDQVKKNARFSVLVLYENGGHHILFSKRAAIWLNLLAADSNFFVQYITDTKKISDSFLLKFQLFLQLDYVPYGWTDTAAHALERYMMDQNHGWIGFHHASLLGEFDGYPMWQWFSDFMGGIKWKDYIANFAAARVNVEDPRHPCMSGVPRTFTIKKDEWYTYDRSPRPNVHVIASVDESSYDPPSTVRMGDHPVIWSNEKLGARNIYIFMGHSPELFDDDAYTKIFKNAIFWAAHQR
jgi:type 1 glutamine amidotransferase